MISARHTLVQTVVLSLFFLTLFAEVQLGMHISAIRKFIQDHPVVREKNLTTSDINHAIVKPESLGTRKPYINLYSGQYDSAGNSLVSKATVFVSHAWRYLFYDVVANVMEQHAQDDPDAYFWFDLFTNDQNEVSSKDFDWFSTTF